MRRRLCHPPPQDGSCRLPCLQRCVTSSVWWQSSWLVLLVAGCHAFSVWTQFTVPAGKRSEHPRGMLLVTRMAALPVEQRRETQWHCSRAKSLFETEHRTVLRPRRWDGVRHQLHLAAGLHCDYCLLIGRGEVGPFHSHNGCRGSPCLQCCVTPSVQ
jgi:hypothetical protein